MKKEQSSSSGFVSRVRSNSLTSEVEQINNTTDAAATGWTIPMGPGNNGKRVKPKPPLGQRRNTSPRPEQQVSSSREQSSREHSSRGSSSDERDIIPDPSSVAGELARLEVLATGGSPGRSGSKNLTPVLNVVGGGGGIRKSSNRSIGGVVGGGGAMGVVQRKLTSRTSHIPPPVLFVGNAAGNL